MSDVTQSTREQQPPLEEVIADLRKLADEAGEDLDERKEGVDLSGADPSHMAFAEMQGMRNAFQQAWQLAISKREEASDGE